MKTSDFYYDLPQELIAQDPLEDRSASRLMVLDKKTGKIQHHIFKDSFFQLFHILSPSFSYFFVTAQYLHSYEQKSIPDQLR